MKSEHLRQILATVMAILLALMTFRVLANVVLPRLGLADVPLFFSPEDRFADSLKVAIAQTTITHPLWHDPRVANWPPFMQRYVFHNEYLQPGATVHHLPPLSTLLMMSFAILFFLMPPVGIICGLLACYAVGALGVARTVGSLSREKVTLAAFVLLVLSYPALFMMDRGNLHSGFTTLLVLLYIFTLFYSRLRGLGWLALALAANIRPNVALFALLELGSDHTWRDTVKAYATMGAVGLIAGLGSLWLANRIDQTYSLSEFLRSYAWYQKGYVEGLGGMGWNLSLQNLVKLVRFQAGFRMIYDPIMATSIMIFGIFLTFFILFLRMFKNIPEDCFAFFITAICAIFTPVFTEYHAVIFVGPLLLLLLNRSYVLSYSALWRGAGLLFFMQLVCLAALFAPLAIVLVILAILFPFLAIRLSGVGEGQREYVMILACIASLAPLGGEITNGPVIALLLISTLIWSIWQSVTSAKRVTEARP